MTFEEFSGWGAIVSILVLFLAGIGAALGLLIASAVSLVRRMRRHGRNDAS